MSEMGRKKNCEAKGSHHPLVLSCSSFLTECTAVPKFSNFPYTLKAFINYNFEKLFR